MKLKQVISIILIMLMLIPSTSAVFAAEPPDLTITDVRLSKEAYQVGDVVAVFIDIKNVGGTAMDLGWHAIQAYDGTKNYEGWEPLGETSYWTRPKIFPGETITVSLNDIKITAEEVKMRVICNSSYKAEETNRSNNIYYAIFTPNKKANDLVINNISVNGSDVAEGGAVTFEVEYQNKGISEIDYAPIEVELKIGSKTYIISETTNVEKGETRKIKSEPLYVLADEYNITAYINPNDTVSETDYSNNEYTKTISALKSKGSEYAWEAARLGGGGYVRNVFVSESFKDEIFFLTDVNAIYKYNPYSDFNEQLILKHPVSQYSFNVRNAVGMEMDPNNSQTIFFAGGSRVHGSEGNISPSYLLRSFDGGKTWTEIEKEFEYSSKLDFCNGVLEIDPNNSNILYSASVKRGLFRTKNALDRAPEWEKLDIPGYTYSASGDTPVVGVIADKSVVENGISQNIYVAVRGFGVYKSVDGGESFALMEGSPSAGLYNIWLDANGSLLVSGDCGLWQYKDSVWTDISPYEGKRYYCATNPNNANVIAAVTGDNIYVTTDGAISWREICKSASVENRIPWHRAHWYSNSPGGIRFDPFNNNRLIYGAWYGAYHTMDVTKEEIVWEDITYGINELFIRAMITLPEGADATLIIGTNDVNGVKVDTPYDFPTTLVEEPWIQETVGLAFCEKHPEFIARNGGYDRGAGAGNGAYSTDSGNTWTEFPAYPLKVDGVTRAQNGKITVASDYNEDGIPTILINTLTSSYGGVTEPGKVYRSDDLGQTWTHIDTLPNDSVKRFLHTNEPLAADKVNKDVFYFYDSDLGRFLTSTDGGKTFAEKNTTLPLGDFYSVVVPVPEKEGCVFVSINKAGLYYTSDYGKSFTKIEGVDESRYFDLGKDAPCNVGVPTLYVYGVVNGHLGMFRSTDFGETFVEISDFSKHTLWNYITTIKADRRTFGVVYVGTEGSGIIVGYPEKYDSMMPRVGVYNDLDGKTVNKASLVIEGQATKAGEVHLVLNGNDNVVSLDENLKYSKELTFKEGENTLVIYSVDESLNKSNEITNTFTYDKNYVGLSLAAESAATTESTYNVVGMIDTSVLPASVYVDGEAVIVDKETGIFNKVVNLSETENIVEVTAVLDDTAKETVEMTVIRDFEAPNLTFEDLPKVTQSPLLAVRATLDEPGIVTANGNQYAAYSKDKLDLIIPFALQDGANKLTMEITDLLGNTKTQTIDVTFEADDEYKKLKQNEVVAYLSTPQIDGELDGAWKLNRTVSKACEGSPRIAAKYGLLADENYLYFAAEVFDMEVKKGETEAASAFSVDSIEICFDPDLSRSTKYDLGDQQIRLGIEKTAYSGTKAIPLNEIITSSKITDEGYIIEAAIPWELIMVEYTESGKFGFEVSINDSSNGTSRDGVVCWAADARSYIDTSKFGTVYIGKK